MKIAVVRDPITNHYARTNGTRTITYWKDDLWGVWVALEIDAHGNGMEDSVSPDNCNAPTKSDIIQLVNSELRK